VLRVGNGLDVEVLTGTRTGGVEEAEVNGVINVGGFFDVVGLDVVT